MSAITIMLPYFKMIPENYTVSSNLIQLGNPIDFVNNTFYYVNENQLRKATLVEICNANVIKIKADISNLGI